MKHLSRLWILMLLSACSENTVTSGLQAEVTALPRGVTATPTAGQVLSPGSEGPQTKGFRTAEGEYVELQRGLLNLTPVQLVRCASAQALLDGVVHALLPAAYAHGGQDGAVPAGVVDVNQADGTEFDLGGLAPAPGRYCALRLELTPVRGALPGSNIDMSGASAYVAPCRYSRSSAVPPLPGAPFDPGALFEDGCLSGIKLGAGGRSLTVALDAPLSLDATARRAQLHLTIAYDRWFDGVDLGALETDAAEQARLLDNITQAMRVSVP